jgi:hypothetical protein
MQQLSKQQGNDIKCRRANKLGQRGKKFGNES